MSIRTEELTTGNYPTSSHNNTQPSSGTTASQSLRLLATCTSSQSKGYERIGCNHRDPIGADKRRESRMGHPYSARNPHSATIKIRDSVSSCETEDLRRKELGSRRIIDSSILRGRGFFRWSIRAHGTVRFNSRYPVGDAGFDSSFWSAPKGTLGIDTRCNPLSHLYLINSWKRTWHTLEPRHDQDFVSTNLGDGPVSFEW